MSKTILIVANGKSIDPVKAMEIASRADIIVAADGGALFCSEINLKPDFIIGDLDSVPETIMKSFPQEQLLQKKDQDLTDLQKALELALQLEAGRIMIINSQGFRTDHAAVNLLIFHSFSRSEILEIYDDFGVMRILLPGKHEFSCFRDQTISLFSLQKITGLTLKGFQFPLTEQSFTHPFIGISNRTISQKVSISFTTGKLFFYKLDGQKSKK